MDAAPQNGGGACRQLKLYLTYLCHHPACGANDLEATWKSSLMRQVLAYEAGKSVGHSLVAQR
jgi:hypothetical protein